jgi:hypothetical protein
MSGSLGDHFIFFPKNKMIICYQVSRKFSKARDYIKIMFKIIKVRSLEIYFLRKP